MKSLHELYKDTKLTNSQNFTSDQSGIFVRNIERFLELLYRLKIYSDLEPV